MNGEFGAHPNSTFLPLSPPLRKRRGGRGKRKAASCSPPLTPPRLRGGVKPVQDSEASGRAWQHCVATLGTSQRQLKCFYGNIFEGAGSAGQSFDDNIRSANTTSLISIALSRNLRSSWMEACMTLLTQHGQMAFVIDS